MTAVGLTYSHWAFGIPAAPAPIGPCMRFATLTPSENRAHSSRRSKVQMMTARSKAGDVRGHVTDVAPGRELRAKCG